MNRFSVRLLRSTTPVLLCLRTGLSISRIFCARRSFSIGPDCNYASLDKERGDPCLINQFISIEDYMNAADRERTIVVSEYDVDESNACRTQCFRPSM